MSLNIEEIIKQGRKVQLEALIQGDKILMMDAPTWHKSTITEIVMFDRIEKDKIHWFGRNFEQYSAPIKNIPHIFKMVK